jgi:beta-galactosidase
MGVLMTPRDIRVNDNWAFHREESPLPLTLNPYTGSDWEPVILPHSARLEDDTASEFHSFQGIVWYKKTFMSSPAWQGKRVGLKFEGAMQVADVWVNGTHRLQHTGGYLPFDLDLSNDLGGDIEVELRLDNRDNASFPPGRPQSGLDFTYAGGLYRNVWLEVTNPSYIADVYAYSKNVTEDAAEVVVQPTIGASEAGQSVVINLFDPRGNLVGTKSQMVNDQPRATIKVARPSRWDLDRPNLYRVVTRLTQGGRVIDEVSTRVGIRELMFDQSSGFKINGRPVRLEGSNRHMGFPIIGNAASDAAQYREAKRLRNLGLNILRLAHYPQSPAFLDACDELGILVIDPIPGWQFFQNTPEFKAHVFKDIEETVRRDRNHPSVAIFETCLNETYSPPDEFWLECHSVAHAAFGEGNFFTGGDAYGKRDYSRPIWDVPWTGWDDEKFTRPALFKGQKGIDREYGDYEFGGEDSSSRVDRGGGEGALLLQAWNFIWSHNRNRGNPWSFGDLTWEAIDTYRGMNPTYPISRSGMLDLFRLPKPAAYFFQSQGTIQPMVKIANSWSPRPSPTKVVVFSNCESVALLLNEKEIARQNPDSGPTTGYIGPKIADPLYWAHGKGEIVPATQINDSVGGDPGALPFTGGNCQNLCHPPFTFEGVPYAGGKLEAIGYQGGKPVAKDRIFTPGKPTHLAIRVDTQERALQADGSDFLFVYVEVLDDHDQVVPDSRLPLELKVHGAGEVLGATKRAAVAGIAPFMIRSKQHPGTVSIEAVGTNLKSVKTAIRSVKS